MGDWTWEYYDKQYIIRRVDKTKQVAIVAPKTRTNDIVVNDLCEFIDDDLAEARRQLAERTRPLEYTLDQWGDVIWSPAASSAEAPTLAEIARLNAACDYADTEIARLEDTVDTWRSRALKADDALDDAQREEDAAWDEADMWYDRAVYAGRVLLDLLDYLDATDENDQDELFDGLPEWIQARL